jgi:hypothetical protein
MQPFARRAFVVAGGAIVEKNTNVSMSHERTSLLSFRTSNSNSGFDPSQNETNPRKNVREYTDDCVEA